MNRDEQIIDEVKRHAPDGRITCESAMALAQRLGIGHAELGRLLNELEIKLTKCQFGCF